jgi:hypothetical protein
MTGGQRCRSPASAHLSNMMLKMPLVLYLSLSESKAPYHLFRCSSIMVLYPQTQAHTNAHTYTRGGEGGEERPQFST